MGVHHHVREFVGGWAGEESLASMRRGHVGSAVGPTTAGSGLAGDDGVSQLRDGGTDDALASWLLQEGAVRPRQTLDAAERIVVLQDQLDGARPDHRTRGHVRRWFRGWSSSGEPGRRRGVGGARAHAVGTRGIRPRPRVGQRHRPAEGCATVEPVTGAGQCTSASMALLPRTTTDTAMLGSGSRGNPTPLPIAAMVARDLMGRKQ